MPTSAKKSPTAEFFYEEDGGIADADLHNAILDQGNHEEAEAVSTRVRARILKRAHKKEWDEGKHPRVPSGSSEGGEFTSGGGGGGSDTPQLAPSPPPKLPSVKDVPKYPGRRDGDEFKGKKIYDRRIDPSYFEDHKKLKDVDELTTILQHKAGMKNEYYVRQWAFPADKPTTAIEISQGGRLRTFDVDFHEGYGSDQIDPHAETVPIRQAGGPGDIASSLAQVEVAHQAHLARVKAAMDALPIGYEIKYKKETFTHTDVAGDKFWISDKGKGYTAIQLYEHVGTAALISHIGHEALGQHGSGTGAAGTTDQKPSGEKPSTGDTGKHFVSLAERGVISHELAAELERRATNVDKAGNKLGYGEAWPKEFQQKLAGALTELPPSMAQWAGKADTSGYVPLRVNYRSTLDDVPPGLRSAFESAAAVTVNHSRIEFFKDRFPTPETLRHEMTHLAWYDLTRGRYDSSGTPRTEDRSAAGPVINEAVNDTKKVGDALVKFARKVGSKTKPPPAPAGVDPDQWFRVWQSARSIRKDLNFLRKYKRNGTLTSSQMKGSLELHLMVPSEDTVWLAKYLGHDIPSAQLGTIAEYHGIANVLGVPLIGEFAEEEPVAYRAGVDKNFAQRLFANAKPL